MLKQLLDVRGVRTAALLDDSGQILESLGAAPDASLVATGRSVASSLSQALGGGELRDMIIDFEDGPVLLTNLGGRTLITVFDDVANLGRLRFAVKRAFAKG